MLRAAGFLFDVLPADVDESARPGEAAAAYVLRVARDKAAAVLVYAGDRMVIAADTVVVVDDQILGKPTDEADAARMLRLLSGRRHDVLTAVVMERAGQPAQTHVERTIVEFEALSESEVAAYIASGEPRDKAGGYGVQGLASRFVRHIEGSYTSVVGLPVARVYAMLEPRESAGWPAGSAPFRD